MTDLIVTDRTCYYRMLRNFKGNPGGRSMWPRFKSLVKRLRLDGIEPEIFIGKVYYQAIWGGSRELSRRD